MVESGGIGLVFNLKPKVPPKQQLPNMQVNIQKVPPKQHQPNMQNVPAANMENNLKRPAGLI